MTMENTTPTEDETREVDGALDPDLDRLSRRTFLGRAGAQAAGVAAVGVLTATGQAQTADTPKRALDDDSLNKSEITFSSKGASDTPADIKAFLALPKGDGKHGAVIVIHEIFGLTDHIKDVACRLAQAGYIAFAPDLFTREGQPPDMSKGIDAMMQFVGKISDTQIMNDLKAGMAHLRALPQSNHKVGSVGFCWGGRVSMLLDAYAPDLNAAVAYYGRISGQKTDNNPTYPIDVVDKMHSPLLGHFGEEDKSIPPSEANKLRDALKAHHKTGEIYVYEKTGHAFNNDTRESYRPEAAKLAWKRTLDWFGHYLKS